MPGLKVKRTEQLMNAHIWQTFTFPGFELQFQYPQTTPSGHAVDMDEIRVHFRSRESPELYFEVSRHLHLSADAVYEREKGFIMDRLKECEVSALKPITFASQPAYEFSFRWTDGERAVILIEKQEYLYRVIYDPRSQLNLQVLATIQIV